MRLLQLDTDGPNYLKQKLWIQGILVPTPLLYFPVAFSNYLQWGFFSFFLAFVGSFFFALFEYPLWYSISNSNALSD